ncbi:MAG: hypothetical protein JW732_02980 [Dehalococcoidia bacterium]|nr:hypothetical protein [Dehalococcoidia bacterium]
MKAACIWPSKKIACLAALAIIITLLGGCASSNHTPIITSLKAERETPSASDSYQIECVASDEDGDELSYEWSTSKGYIDGNGATIVWHPPSPQGIYSITVKLSDGNGGEATDFITITVSGNSPPIVHSLTADIDWLTPSSSCRLECSATDPNGDRLSYEWSASQGKISGTGSVVTWTAPETTGLYTITVVVTDSHDEKDTKSLTISVAANNPPVVRNLVVTPRAPEYLKEHDGEYRILRGVSCEIECIAYDPEGDEIRYEWSADDGDISGQGSAIVWKAPLAPRPTTVTVTITVSDSSGNAIAKDIIFEVLTCAPCF